MGCRFDSTCAHASGFVWGQGRGSWLGMLSPYVIMNSEVIICVVVRVVAVIGWGILISNKQGSNGQNLGFVDGGFYASSAGGLISF